jgi:hypothetical protein
VRGSQRCRGCSSPGLCSSRGRPPSSHRCRDVLVLHHLTQGSCVTWRTRKVVSGDDDRSLVVRHSVDVTGSAFGQSQVTSTDFPGQEAPGKEGEIMRMQKHGDPPCGHLRRQQRLRIAPRSFVATLSVLPVYRYCRRCGWNITALKELWGGDATSTPRLLTAPTLPMLPLRRPLAEPRSQVARERVGGGLYSH